MAVLALWRLHCCLLCLPCRAYTAVRCFCVNAGQGATSNAIALGVALRRRICLAFPHPAAHGLLSLIRLLRRAFLLNAIKRNQAHRFESPSVGSPLWPAFFDQFAWSLFTNRNQAEPLFSSFFLPFFLPSSLAGNGLSEVELRSRSPPRNLNISAPR